MGLYNGDLSVWAHSEPFAPSHHPTVSPRADTAHARGHFECFMYEDVCLITFYIILSLLILFNVYVYIVRAQLESVDVSQLDYLETHTAGKCSFTKDVTSRTSALMAEGKSLIRVDTIYKL